MQALVRRIGAMTALAVLAVAGPAAADNVGIKAVAVVWNPAAPDKQGIQELVNRPTAVSDAVNLGWSQSRDDLCNQVKTDLGKAGLVGGQTLYDISCNMSSTMGGDG